MEPTDDMRKHFEPDGSPIRMSRIQNGGFKVRHGEQLKTSRGPRIAADLRSPLARARDDFLESDAGQRACDPVTLKAPADQRQYLTHRIEAAFLAGVAAARSIPAQHR
jgi:hypothetical protein